MKKCIAIVAAAALILPFEASASCQWNILGESYNVDTLYHATIGPGTTETEIRISSAEDPSSEINNIFYTVTDLANPYVKMRAAKGGNHFRALEIVPEIADRMSGPGEQYFAGVNADFFNMSYPYSTCGHCVAGGYLTNIGSDNWAHIVFDENGIPMLADRVSLTNSGVFTIGSGQSVSFKMNKSRSENDLILYTPQWQETDSVHGFTGTNKWGTEVQVRPVGENILAGNTLRLEVIADPVSYIGNMAIPSDGYVISAHGTAMPYIRDLKKGDILTASVSFSADGSNMKAKELLGGCPLILAGGTVRPLSNAIDHLKNKEPRTAVGHNSDKTKLYMVVVDGRNAGGSTGVTQTQLGEIMKLIGCSDAMNFDGGGSSTMYIDALGIRNIPSSSSLDNRPEGQPRTVVNALFAVSTAPVDNRVASIELRDKKVELATGETYMPVVYGYNKYGVLVSTDLDGCTFSVPSAVATVSGNVLTGGEGRHSAVLTAVCGAMTYSVPVYLNGGGEFVAGIADQTVSSDDAAPEYYLLNGVRVSEPVSNAVVITRRGSEISKEIKPTLNSH